MRYSDAKHYIGRLYTETTAYIEYDDPATTFTCCGAVLVASILSGTSSADVLSALTGLPVNFAAAVLLFTELQGETTDERLEYVREALDKNPDDFTDVEDALFCVLEEVWASRNGFNVVDILERLREGVLIGGGRQRWIDDGTHEPPEDRDLDTVFEVVQ